MKENAIMPLARVGEIVIKRPTTVADAAIEQLADVLMDCVSGDAERLYVRLGWERVGTIPDYALLPQGGLIGTTLFYRRVAPA